LSFFLKNEKKTKKFQPFHFEIQKKKKHYNLIHKNRKIITKLKQPNKKKNQNEKSPLFHSKKKNNSTKKFKHKILIFATISLKKNLYMLRFKAVEEAFKKKPLKVEAPSRLTSDYYGKYVFNESAMSKYLSKDTLKSLKNAIEKAFSCHATLLMKSQQE
jgi:hypothetical protein